MKNIIIVGVGRAALLHYNSYNKLKKIGKIYFVDIKKISKYIKNIKMYSSIKEYIIVNQLKKSNLIIDIYTPKSELLSILNMYKEKDLKDILIEKPFIISGQDLKKYHNSNIVSIKKFSSGMKLYCNNLLVRKDERLMSWVLL